MPEAPEASLQNSNESLPSLLDATNADDPTAHFRDREHYGNQIDTWVAEQNDHLEQLFAENHVDLPAIRERLKKIDSMTRISAIKAIDGGIFVRSLLPDQEAETIGILTEEGTIQPLFNSETLETLKHVAINKWEPSKDGKFVALEMVQQGQPWGSLRVFDREHSSFLPLEIPNTPQSNPSWRGTEGFYYQSTEKLAQREHRVTKYHSFGSSNDGHEDPIIFDPLTSDHPDYSWPDVFFNDNGTNQYLVLQTESGTAGPKNIYVADVSLTPDPKKFIPLAVNEADGTDHNYVKLSGDSVYLLTDREASHFHVFRSSLSEPIHFHTEPIWEEVFKEPDTGTIKDIFTTENGLIVHTRTLTESNVFRIDAKTNQISHIDLPFEGTLGAVSFSDEDQSLYARVDLSLRTPEIIKISPDNNITTVFTQEQIIPKVFLQSREITTPDGNVVPMAILSKHEISDEPRPTVIWAYGGFGSIPELLTNQLFIDFVDQWDGNIIIASPSGDGLLGSEQHEHGMQENKIHTYTDMVACIQYAVEQNIAQKGKIILVGESNGGLTALGTSAHLEDAGNILAGVIGRIPIINLEQLGKERYSNYFKREYGDPDNPDHLTFLRNNPLRLLDPKRNDPPTFIIVGTADALAAEWHGEEYVALGQAMGKDFYLYKQESGHGGGSSRRERTNVLATALAFIEVALQKKAS